MHVTEVARADNLLQECQSCSQFKVHQYTEKRPNLPQVKVLYVRNLKSDVTEEQLKEKFEPYGKIERVKKIKDYGFIHFEDRDDAVKAMEDLNGTVISFKHCWLFF